MQYSWFCARYRAWAAKVDVVMRQEHRAGEKMFVDYAGHTVPVVDRETGELREAQIFVAVLGASNYTYGEATWTQTLPDWIASHVRAFQFHGRQHGAADPGQSALGGEPREPLRARHQFHLPRPGLPLRGGRAPGSGEKTEG